MKKLMLFWLLFLHSTTTVHFAQANSITETISSTASLLFSAKVLIPVTLGTALYYSLVAHFSLSRENDRLREQNNIYKAAFNFHEIKFAKRTDWNSSEILSQEQPIGGKFKTLFEKSEENRRELIMKVADLEERNNFLRNALDAMKSNNPNFLLKK